MCNNIDTYLLSKLKVAIVLCFQYRTKAKGKYKRRWKENAGRGEQEGTWRRTLRTKI
jgi:hypothetical protein